MLRNSSDPVVQLQEIAAEQERRAKEALKCYRPYKQMPFHLGRATEQLISGGKRSGKTTGAAAEFASRVTGIPIMGPHNRKIPSFWPVSRKADPLLYFIIGWDIDHIGQTLYHKLFAPGLFRVIKDKATGIWRTYNPADPYDSQRRDESEPANPLIPERLIEPKSWCWESKSAYNFSSVRLKNGATICAYPSSAKHPKQGDSVHGIWIDEDIQFGGHLKEWQDRLTDSGGWLLWSVWPHAKNLALCDLVDRAEEVKDDPNPDILHFQLTMSENPFITDENKRKALSRMGSEEEIARRDRGDMLRGNFDMYDVYPGFHIAETATREELLQPSVTPKDKVQKILSTNGRLPREWTRYLAIDPSHTRTAVTFGVVPPTDFDDFHFGDLLIIERELVVKKHSAKQLAFAVRQIVQGLNYEAFIMDQNIGRQTRVGGDRTVFQIYSDAFAMEKIVSRGTHSSFIPGCNITSTRYSAVRQLLEADSQTGSPRLMFVGNTTPETQKEFRTYRKKRVEVGGIETILDEPENPRKHDCIASLEYLCAYVGPLLTAGTAYVDPSNYSGQASAVLRRARKLLAKQQESQGYVHMGPGAAA